MVFSILWTFKYLGVISTGSMAYDAVFVKIPFQLSHCMLATESVEKNHELVEFTRGNEMSTISISFNTNL